MKIGFLFAGQGVQKVGMADSFLNDENFLEIFNKLSCEVQDIVKNGTAEKINETEIAQQSILFTSLGIANILKSRGIECEYSAGLSLGEYSALTYAKVIDIDDVLEIIKYRGRVMADSFIGKETGMIAVLNSDVDTIQNVISEFSNLEIANYNSPKQIVITGDKNSIKLAVEKFKEKKIRTIPLNVSGAFHSSYLNGASEIFYKFLEKYKFNDMKNKVVFNYLGSTIKNEDIKEVLKNQMKSSVKFMQSIDFMIEKGVDTFIEIGPGNVLSSFVNQIDSKLKVYNVSSMEDVERVVSVLNV